MQKFDSHKKLRTMQAPDSPFQQNRFGKTALHNCSKHDCKNTSDTCNSAKLTDAKKMMFHMEAEPLDISDGFRPHIIFRLENRVYSPSPPLNEIEGQSTLRSSATRSSRVPPSQYSMTRARCVSGPQAHFKARMACTTPGWCRDIEMSRSSWTFFSFVSVPARAHQRSSLHTAVPPPPSCKMPSRAPAPPSRRLPLQGTSRM